MLPKGERRGAAVGFAALFLVLLGHMVLETARDALFLERLTADRLPWAYLLITLAVVGFAKLNAALLSRLNRRWVTTATPLVLSVLTLGFRSVVQHPSPSALIMFYVWVGVVGSILATQIWTTLGDTFTVTQAKRAFPLVGLGAIVGATSGASLSKVLLTTLETADLIVVGAGVIGLVALPMRLVPVPTQGFKAETVPREAKQMRRQMFKGEPYLRKLVLLAMTSTVALTVVDYLFKSTVAREVPSDQLGDFFATYYAVINGAALVVQLLLGPWLLRRLGVNRTLRVMPILLSFSLIGFFATGGLLPALFLKAVDGSLRHSVQKTSFEFLFLPLSSDVRTKAKAFIDGLGQRGGQALASALILASIYFGASELQLGIGLALALPLWVLLTLFVRKDYVRLFRAQLREGTGDVGMMMEDLDLQSMEALLSALNSEDDREVMAALEIFASHDRIHLVPALLLYHPSTQITLAALRHFEAAGVDVKGVAARLSEHQDPEVRAAAIRHCGLGRLDETRILAALDADDPYLRINAAVAMFSARPNTKDRAFQVIIDACEEGPHKREILAYALRGKYSPDLHRVLDSLSRFDEPRLHESLSLALSSPAVLETVPIMLRMLAIRRARENIRLAFKSLGSAGLRALEDALGDTSLERRIRKHVPRSISRFGTDEAVLVLQQHMWRETDGGIRYKILRGLSGMVQNNPELKVDRGLVFRNMERTLRRAVRALRWRVQLETLSGSYSEIQSEHLALLTDLLREKEKNAIERLFHLFRVLKPQEDFDLLYDGLKSPQPKVRASSQELIEYLVPPKLREPVVALIGDGHDTDRLRGAQSVLEGESSVIPESKGVQSPVDRALLACLHGVSLEGSRLMRRVAGSVADERHLQLEINDGDSRGFTLAEEAMLGAAAV